MPTTESVPVTRPVNETAVNLIFAARGTLDLAHYSLTAESDRNEDEALRWIGKAITDLNDAADAIHTGLVREVQP